MINGFADTVASTLVEGENLVEGLKDLFKGIAKQIIATLVKIGAQLLINAALDATTKKKQATNSGGLALSNGVASMAGAPFPINLLAPIFGAAMQALALGGAATISASTGGIVTGATTATVGEGGEPEAIIPLSRLKDMVGGEQTIMVMLDGREITRAVVQEMPSVIRVETGVTM